MTARDKKRKQGSFLDSRVWKGPFPSTRETMLATLLMLGSTSIINPNSIWNNLEHTYIESTTHLPLIWFALTMYFYTHLDDTDSTYKKYRDYWRRLAVISSLLMKALQSLINHIIGNLRESSSGQKSPW